ncbi:MAG: hypothetical protein NTY38_08350 [Acidobacteria bacterium]|nr:hypothetical protein [Acidobacteriota bacterium]
MREVMDRSLDEIRARQRNVVWPDLAVNAGLVDRFLWKGSPKASLVQRIAAWLFGANFAVVGFVILAYANREASLFGVIVSLGIIALGVKVFLSGCRRHHATLAETPSDRGRKKH